MNWHGGPQQGGARQLCDSETPRRGSLVPLLNWVGFVAVHSSKSCKARDKLPADSVQAVYTDVNGHTCTGQYGIQRMYTLYGGKGESVHRNVYGTVYTDPYIRPLRIRCRALASRHLRASK